MVTTISLHTTARHTGITGPSGSAAACSSEPALGSAAPATSTATLLTASIRITAMLVHIRTVETSPLITSTETKCVMDAATQGVEVTVRNSVKPKAKGVLLSGSARRAQLLGNPETALLGGSKSAQKSISGRACRGRPGSSCFLRP